MKIVPDFRLSRCAFTLIEIMGGCGGDGHHHGGGHSGDHSGLKQEGMRKAVNAVVDACTRRAHRPSSVVRQWNCGFIRRSGAWKSAR